MTFSSQIFPGNVGQHCQGEVEDTVNAMIKRRAMTLVELLVVIAIVGMLVALLLPAVQAAREAARRSQCANNLKQMGLAAQERQTDVGTFPASLVKGTPFITWAKSLLPYIELRDLYDAFDDKFLIHEGPNAKLAAKVIPIYKCPTAPSPAVYEFTSSLGPGEFGTMDYKGVQGANASDPSVRHWKLSGWQSGVTNRKELTPAQITDGLSQTVLFLESVGGKQLYGPGGGPWTPAEIWSDFPADGSWVGRAFSSVSPVNYASVKNLASCTVNCSNMYDYGPYSFHPGGAQAALCDGAVIFWTEEIDPAVLAGYYVYNEGQLIQNQ
jgi:prepilin-type N-terminal cleavage/methylation domain-containing protein